MLYPPNIMLVKFIKILFGVRIAWLTHVPTIFGRPSMKDQAKKNQPLPCDVKKEPPQNESVPLKLELNKCP